MDKETRQHLQRQLINLGEMMGDGQHLEKGGKWIEREYRKALKALYPEYFARSRKARTAARNTAIIDEAMLRRVNEVPCMVCGNMLIQIRRGSYMAKCGACGTKHRLLERVRSKA